MDPRILILPVLLAMSSHAAAPFPVPARDGSASGALRQAMQDGRTEVPWTISAELDGQAEEWLPWTGLPLREIVVSPDGSGEDDISGSAGAAGPLAAHAVAATTEVGFGGLERRFLLAHPLASDTPSTSVHFWRGAVNSYRFGLGLSRNLVGPWSFDMRMNARSAPGRFWEYRQQVNDMYGPRGKPQGLPYQGQGPGQDDVRWEATGSRSLPGGRLDIGWNWVDDQRGVPDPQSTWDSLRPKRDAYTSRSGLFGRIELEREGWSLRASARRESRDWSLPSWSDTGDWAEALGTETVQAGTARLGWGPRDMRLFLEAFHEGTDGSADVPRVDSAFDGGVREARSRVGASLHAARGIVSLEAGGGWNRMDPFVGQDLSAFDMRGEVRCGTDSTHALARWSRSALLPGFAEQMRPDVFRPRLATSGLEVETRDLAELRAFWSGNGLSAEIGGAILSIEDGIRPQVLPSAGAPDHVSRALALRPVNRVGTIHGFSTDAALHASWRWFQASTRAGFGRTGLPGEPLGGESDLSEPQWRTRSSVGWSAELLPGRFRASSSLALSTWGESRIYVPTGTDDAELQELPASWGLDFEARCEIRTFEIFWRMENLGDRKQYVLPGWTPLGLRAGWGVVWSFGG